MKEKIKVEFEAITPVFTGDAWSKCSELKPSSIIGSLRFWFEVYCHFARIEVKYEESLDYKKFLKKLKEKIIKHQNNNQDIDLEEISDEILSQMGISLPSRIFGCTGWKSRVEIENIKYDLNTLKLDDIDTEFLINTDFWTKKVLFNGKKELKYIENIQVDFKISPNFKDEFLRFLKFYEDKFILLGGKKSFGFGFVKLKYENLRDLNEYNENIRDEQIVIWDSLDIKEIAKDKIKNKKILGYNIKYFLRKKERKKFRDKNFGKKGEASNFYFSMIDNSNSICHIISLLNINNINKIINKYKQEIENALRNNTQ